MRNIVCILLFLVLCSNECNAPYNAKMDCRGPGAACKFQFHNSLEFSMTAADVSWWKGSLEVGMYYKARNTSPDNKDSIDYGRFSVVCSNGITLEQGHREVRVHGTNIPASAVYTLPPAASIDTIMVFYSAKKYGKKAGMKILKNERFSLLYSDGSTDTLLTVTGNDSRIR